MSNDTFMHAREALRREFRDLEDDLRRARDELANEIESATGRLGRWARFQHAVATTLAENEDANSAADDEDDGFDETMFEVEAEADAAVETALENFDWASRQALRRLKQALEREVAPC